MFPFVTSACGGLQKLRLRASVDKAAVHRCSQRIFRYNARSIIPGASHP
jgi:hypothetical protein